MTNPTEGAGPIRSEYAGETDMREIIRLFVDEMPERIGELQRAWDEADRASLAMLAHRMKGAAPGYGFGLVGHAAAELEAAAMQAGDDLARVREEFETLIDLCSRATV